MDFSYEKADCRETWNRLVVLGKCRRQPATTLLEALNEQAHRRRGRNGLGHRQRCPRNYSWHSRCQCQGIGYLRRMEILHFSIVGIVGHFAIPDRPSSFLHLVSVLGVSAQTTTECSKANMKQPRQLFIHATAFRTSQVRCMVSECPGSVSDTCNYLYSFVQVLKCNHPFLQCYRGAPDCTPQVKHTALAPTCAMHCGV